MGQRGNQSPNPLPYRHLLGPRSSNLVEVKGKSKITSFLVRRCPPTGLGEGQKLTITPFPRRRWLLLFKTQVGRRVGFRNRYG